MEKRDLRDLNRYYKHFTALVKVLGKYMTKVTYGHGIGSAGIVQVFPVENKLLALFGEGG